MNLKRLIIAIKMHLKLKK